MLPGEVEGVTTGLDLGGSYDLLSSFGGSLELPAQNRDQSYRMHFDEFP